MIQAGEIYLADTERGKRPAVILSRAELNRGHWIGAVLMTSAPFGIRSKLPHCVAFRAGEFGLSKDCVVQAETISYLAVSDLDIDFGKPGALDESKLRELIRAVGNMMGSDCEPV